MNPVLEFFGLSHDFTTLVMDLAYLGASVLFILGLKFLSSPKTARRGMFLAELGMAFAIIGTLLHFKIITYVWILIGVFIGSTIGVLIAAFTPMTAMPQRTALSHAFGALAAALVGVAEYYSHGHELSHTKMAAIGFEVMLGGLTFTGSMIAFGKLQTILPSAPLQYRGQHIVNMIIFLSMIGCFVYSIVSNDASFAFYGMVGLALLFGNLLVLPIGAADMPVVMSLLNAYAGLAGSATGFVLNNNVLIIAGALDGASGVILSVIMCKAMNRSMLNVLFGGFGGVNSSAATETAQGNIMSATPEEAGMVLETAQSVIFVPGYGMAVSQAQHSVKKLSEGLTKKGVKVRFAIHPVAGRMPGHMNVLLAEAKVEYDQLFDLDQINDDFSHTDVAIVIGANDVVNPAAKTNRNSPIYGMPVLNVEQAKTVMVLKRSMNPGFAGIENELFYLPNTMMIFGDANKSLQEISKNIGD